MKIKRTYRALLSMITVGLLAGNTVAQAATSDNYSENFESYAAGESVVSTNLYGWQAPDTNATMVVTTNYTDAYNGTTFSPLYNASDSKAVWIDSTVTNSIAAGTSGITNWMDVMIKPTISDETPDVPPEGTVAAVYFSTNMHPVVLHTPSNTATYAKWVEIPDITIESNEWIRLTILAYFGPAQDGIVNPTRFYQVMINGSLVSNEVAFAEPTRLSVTNGSWFGNSAAKSRTSPFTNVVVKGTGYIDDLVVTNALSFTDSTMWDITASAGAGGSIAPSGVVPVVEGNSKTFTITADSGYAVDNVEIVEGGITNNIVTNSYTFTSVMTNGWITASFVAAGGPDDPPPSWLTDTGVDEADLDSDLRGDGLTARQSWVASVNPTNATFKFEVTDIRRENGSNLVEWVSVFVDTNLPPFGIWVRTNLMDTTYDLIDTYPRVEGATPSTPVTNVWSEDAPAYPIYYRVVATNAPSGP